MWVSEGWSDRTITYCRIRQFAFGAFLAFLPLASAGPQPLSRKFQQKTSSHQLARLLPPVISISIYERPGDGAVFRQIGPPSPKGTARIVYSVPRVANDPWISFFIWSPLTCTYDSPWPYDTNNCPSHTGERCLAHGRYAPRCCWPRSLAFSICSRPYYSPTAPQIFGYPLPSLETLCHSQAQSNMSPYIQTVLNYQASSASWPS